MSHKGSNGNGSPYHNHNNGQETHHSPTNSNGSSGKHTPNYSPSSHKAWHNAIGYMPSEEIDLDSAISLPHIPLLIDVDSLPDKDGGKAELGGKEEQEEEYEGLLSQKIDISKDKYSIALLIFLYILQGIPLGLAGSVPYLLIDRKVTYTDQAIFSFVHWPYSVKLLWAPVVDSVYWTWFGRRKSWLVPMQYISGIFMLILSYHISYLLGEGDPPKQVHIITLTICFFTLYFLAATQDIAVDGWALTMLSRRNVGWASTCNSMGLTAGYFLGYVMFLALESPAFCNNYIRSTPGPEGIITFSGFLYFWGITFIISTTLVAIFKKESNDPTNPESDSPPVDKSIGEMYSLLWKIIRLPAVVGLSVVLLTSKVGFAAADAVTGLKLIERGVPRENLALLGIPMVPVQIIMPLLISKYTTGPRPMDVFLKAMPYRLLMGVEFMFVVMWTPYTKQEDGSVPFYFYLVMFFSYALQQIALYSMFVSSMAFFAKVSDPVIGGTYMTLLNTLSSLGSSWPNTIALWMVDPLTFKGCSTTNAGCSSKAEIDTCSEMGGTCVNSIDGYYIESIACCILGFLWLLWKYRKVRQLQSLPMQEWTCLKD